MNNMIENLDQTYVHFVLFSKDITAYQLSKMTGISNTTFSRVLNYKQHLNWTSIAKIEMETGIPFKGQEHLIWANEQSFIPRDEQCFAKE